MVKYLCQLKNDDGTYRCDPSDKNNKAIRWAAKYGHLDVLLYLSQLKNDDGTHRWDHDGFESDDESDDD